MPKHYTETVRFRHWVSDTARYEGEACITTYHGSHTTDEFGYYDGDDYEAEIDQLYYCEEGEAPRQVNLAKEIYPNTRLFRDLKGAAIDATDYPPCLPVVFPGEQETVLECQPAYRQAA